MKLLIADDNPDMRALLRRLCATIATESLDCADGNEAVRAFDEFQPDWTLMDLAMPHLDGLDATRHILARHPDARIVMLTQHLGTEYEQAVKDAGACAFVNKQNLQPLVALFAEKASAKPLHS